MSDEPQPPKSTTPENEENSTLEPGRLGDSDLQDVHAQLMREKEEPTEGFSPVPIFFLFIFCAFIFWGAIYIEFYSGEFSAYAFDPHFKDLTADDAPSIDYDSAEWLLAHGERRYNQHCVACHQASGQGAAGAFPPLVGTRWVLGDEERLINILLYGLMGEIEVNGRTYNGVMPGFANTPGMRSDRDIAAVASFIRNAWGNDGSLILQDDVAAVRTQFGDRGAWRGSDLLDLYPLE